MPFCNLQQYAISLSLHLHKYIHKEYLNITCVTIILRHLTTAAFFSRTRDNPSISPVPVFSSPPQISRILGFPKLQSQYVKALKFHFHDKFIRSTSSKLSFSNNVKLVRCTTIVNILFRTIYYTWFIMLFIFCLKCL